VKSLLTVCATSEAEFVTDVGSFAGRLANRMFAGETGQRARIAAHELIENAGRFAAAATEIVVELLSDQGAFELRVSNVALGSRIALLKQQVALAQSIEDTGHYAKLIRARIGAHDGQGLGLLRVRHDAMVELAVELDGPRVTVTAHGVPSTFSRAPRAERPSSSRNKLPTSGG
jgi:hypothetical protein